MSAPGQKAVLSGQFNDPHLKDISEKDMAKHAHRQQARLQRFILFTAVFFITFSPFIRLPRRYVGYNIAHIAYPVNRQIKKISKAPFPGKLI